MHEKLHKTIIYTVKSDLEHQITNQSKDKLLKTDKT